MSEKASSTTSIFFILKTLKNSSNKLMSSDKVMSNSLF